MRIIAEACHIADILRGVTLAQQLLCQGDSFGDNILLYGDAHHLAEAAADIGPVVMDIFSYSGQGQFLRQMLFHIGKSIRHQPGHNAGIFRQALGRGFLVRTAVCTVTSSLFLSLVPPPAAPLVEETLTNCVLGGILVGFSLGIVLTCGCSTGGLDILGLWLAKKGKGFSVGRFSLSFNALLYTLCAVLFGLRAAIYSIIYTVFCALFIDRGHQQNITEQVLIFTKDEDPELPRNIMARLGRGVTYWEGKGAYTGEDLRVLCVCVSKFEEADLYGVVHELDPNAFFITQEGVTIHGNFIRKLS